MEIRLFAVFATSFQTHWEPSILLEGVHGYCFNQHITGSVKNEHHSVTSLLGDSVGFVSAIVNSGYTLHQGQGTNVVHIHYTITYHQHDVKSAIHLGCFPYLALSVVSVCFPRSSVFLVGYCVIFSGFYKYRNYKLKEKLLATIVLIVNEED